MLLGVEAEKQQQPQKLSEQQTIQEMQKEAIRVRGGREIVLDEECCKIAQRWANYMARSGRFGHGGGEQIIAHGYPSVRACFAGWMNSPGHRAWVLSNSARCGWGFQRSASGHCYWVGVFRNGLPKESATAAKETESKTSG